MQKILVPTDFSETAEHALQFAVALANHFGARLTLISTYKVYSNTGMLISVEEHVKKEVATDMLKLMQTYEPLLENGARMDSKLIHADPAPGIAKEADRADYDLIVMGTNGASGLKEVFTGSVTNAVINSTQKPVLVIPNGVRFKHIERIVLAVDNEPISADNKLKTLHQLQQPHQAHLSIFHQLMDVEEDQGIDPSITETLGDIEYHIHYELDPLDVKTSLHEFIKEESFDLLVMIRRERGFFEKLFHRSVTQKEVFDSNLPLLILHDSV